MGQVNSGEPGGGRVSRRCNFDRPPPYINDSHGGALRQTGTSNNPSGRNLPLHLDPEREMTGVSGSCDVNFRGGRAAKKEILARVAAIIRIGVLVQSAVWGGDLRRHWDGNNDFATRRYPASGRILHGGLLAGEHVRHHHIAALLAVAHADGELAIVEPVTGLSAAHR